jgi:hypothetical protein
MHPNTILQDLVWLASCPFLMAIIKIYETPENSELTNLNNMLVQIHYESLLRETHTISTEIETFCLERFSELIESNQIFSQIMKVEIKVNITPSNRKRNSDTRN